MYQGELQFTKAAFPHRESFLVGETLATPSPGGLTPGTPCLLTLSPEAVSCPCLGPQF